MKTKSTLIQRAALLVLLSTLNLQPSTQAEGTAFTYQGRLNDDGSPVSGLYDLRFTLYDAGTNGNTIGGAVTNTATAVGNGLFTVTLDFDPRSFDGSDRWLEIGVRPNRGGAFATLKPRQPITASPHALFARTAAAADSVSPTAVTTASLANGAVTSVKILDGAIAPADLSPTLALNTFWRLDGNAGTDPASDFVGTSDAAPLAFRAGNRQVLRIEGQATGYRIIAGINSVVNSASTNSAVLGGRNNLIESAAHESTIVGGLDNTIRAIQRGAFIGGGARNEIKIDNDYAVIVGGRDNEVGTNCVISLVVGGADNHIANSVDGGLIVGGFRNDIRGSLNPNARQIAPVIVGGSDNEIGLRSNFAAILGGDNNRIGTNAFASAILSGTANSVANNASNSVAVGHGAQANHAGAFVWADSQNADYASTAPDQVSFRCSGGVRFGSGSGGIDQQVRWTPGGASWTFSSDRNLKENLQAVDANAVLEKVCDLPISEWNYKEYAQRHIGPMAQDFHAAFPLNDSTTTLNDADLHGVALAAIQGLNHKLSEQEARLKNKDSEIQELRQAVAALQKIVSQITHKTQEQP